MARFTEKKLEKLLKEPESEHLDFKREYPGPEKKYSLIQDIISLANSRINQEERYIIFGVADDRKLVSLKDSKNRLKQDDIIMLLRDIGLNKRLKLQLHTSLNYEGYELDVLVIEDVNEQPYFLTKPYKLKDETKLAPGVIYTRNGSTNGIVDNDEAFDKIFRKKFGMDSTPLEKSYIYLKNIEGWKNEYNENGELYFYYEQHPEFTILRHDGKDKEQFHEVWSSKFPDKISHKQQFFLKYHSTILKKIIVIESDGARYLTVCPEKFDYIDKKTGRNYLGYYFIKGSLELLLNNMIQEVYFKKKLPKKTVGQYVWFPVFSSKKNADKRFKKDLGKNEQEYIYFFFSDPKQWSSINQIKMIKNFIK